MCKASVVAKEVRRAKQDDKLSVTIGDHGLGTAYPLGAQRSECVVCLKTGDQLTLSNIPSSLREVFGLAAEERAVFKETRGSEYMVVQDKISFPDHPQLGKLLFVDFAGAGIVLSVDKLRFSVFSLESWKTFLNDLTALGARRPRRLNSAA